MQNEKQSFIIIQVYILRTFVKRSLYKCTVGVQTSSSVKLNILFLILLLLNKRLIGFLGGFFWQEFAISPPSSYGKGCSNQGYKGVRVVTPTVNKNFRFASGQRVETFHLFQLRRVSTIAHCMPITTRQATTQARFFMTLEILSSLPACWATIILQVTQNAPVKPAENGLDFIPTVTVRLFGGIWLCLI